MLSQEELRSLVEECVGLGVTDAHSIAVEAIDKDYARGGVPDEEIELAFIDYETKVGRLLAERLSPERDPLGERMRQSRIIEARERDETSGIYWPD